MPFFVDHPTIARDSSSELTQSTQSSKASLHTSQKQQHRQQQMQTQPWSLYSKFSDLERKWSVLHSHTPSMSSSSSNSSSSSSSPPNALQEMRAQTSISGSGPVTRVIKMEDLEKKWNQLHAFATAETKRHWQKHHQQHNKEDQEEEERQEELHRTGELGDTQEREGPSSPLLGKRQLHEQCTIQEELQQEGQAHHLTFALAGEYANIENKEEEEEEGAGIGSQSLEEEDKKPRFVIKKRRGKRPRQLLSLQVRRWNFRRSKSEPAGDKNLRATESSREVEEEVLFESAESRDDTEQHDYIEDEDDNDYYFGGSSTNAQQSIENLTQRLLASMSNQQLWQNSDEQRVDKTGHYFEQLGGWEGLLKQQETIEFSEGLRKMQYLQKSISSADTIKQSGIADKEILYSRREVLSSTATKHDIRVCADSTTSKRSDIDKDEGKEKNELELVVRELLHVRLCAVSAVLIQSWIRMKLSRRKYLNARRVAAKETQSNRGRTRRQLLSPTIARIQKLRKSQYTEKSHKKAIIIQSFWRKWRSYDQYQTIRLSTIAVQRSWRGSLKRRWKKSQIEDTVGGRVQNQIESPASSFDGTGISELSFDNSYLYEDPEIPHPLPDYPSAVTWELDEPMNKSMSPLPPLPPLHPGSLLPPRSPSPQPSRSVYRSLSFTSPCSQSNHSSLSSMRSRGLSPGRPNRNVSSQGQRRLTLLRSKDRPPTFPHLPSKRLAKPLVTSTRKRGQCSLSYVPPRTKQLKLSALARVVSDSTLDEGTLRRRYKDKEKSTPAMNHSIPKRRPSLRCLLKSNQSHGISAVGSSKGSFSLNSQLCKAKNCSQNNVTKQFLTGLFEEVNASTTIQRIWRGYKAQRVVTAMLVQDCTVVCECNKDKVARDRFLRQKVQLVSVTKALGQVGCFGAKENFIFKGDMHLAEWENVIYVSLASAKGEVINTFSTVYVASAVQNSRRIEAMSKRKRFAFIVKAALEQHLMDQEHKVSRISMLERSLTRKRAPLEKEAAIRIQKEARRVLQRYRFVEMKKACITLQKTARCWCVHIAYCRQKEGACKVQSFFRGEIVRGIVFQYWAAAIALRPFWNDRRQMRLAYADFVAARFQAIVRGAIVRQEIFEQTYYATVIQATFRSFNARKRFMCLRRVCLSLQLVARQSIALQRLHKMLSADRIRLWWKKIIILRRLNQRLSADCIQMWWKNTTTLKRLHERLSANYIQSWWKKIRIMKKLKQSLSASFIQLWWRKMMVGRKLKASISAHCIQRLWRNKKKLLFLERNSAASCIQQWWRFGRYDKMMKSMCATTIATSYRRYRECCGFQRLRTATLTIQKNKRGTLVKKRYLQCKFSAIQIQRIQRGVLQRMRLAEQTMASTIISSWYRGASQRRKYENLKRQIILNNICAEKIQRFFGRFAVKRDCAISIQTIWRGYYSRTRYLQLVTASWRVQANWRGHRCRFIFHFHRGAAIYLQRTWRYYYYLQQIRNMSAITIQTAARKMLEVKAIRKKKHAVKIIKLWMNGFVCRCKFLEACESVIVIQGCWRRTQSQHNYMKIRSCVISIQNVCRRWLLLRQMATKIQRRCLRRLKTKHKNAIVIQSEIRRVLSRRDYWLARSAAVMLQRRTRLFCTRQAYLKLCQRTVRVQAWYRCRITRFKFLICQNSIILSQSAWRCHKKKIRFQALRSSTLQLQFWFREMQLKRKQKKAILILQCFARSLASRKKGQLLRAQKRKANKVQMVRMRLRGRVQNFHAKKSAAIFLQCVFRTYRTRLQRRSTIVIQKKVRKWIQKQQYQNQAAIALQKTWRGYASQKKYLLVRRAAHCLVVHLKALHCGKQTRRDFEKAQRGIISFQSLWRGFIRRLVYTKLRRRLDYIKFRVEEYWKRKTQSAVLIQSQWRMASCRSNYVAFRECAVQLQSRWRLRVDRRHYTELRKKMVRNRRAAVLMQSQVRKFLYKSKFDQAHTAAKIMQKYFRQSHFFRINSSKREKAAVKMQTCWRQHAGARFYHQFMGAIVKLQIRSKTSYKKKVSAATKMQSLFRSFHCQKEYLCIVKGAICLQAIFRGIACRSNINTAVTRLYEVLRLLSDQQELKQRSTIFVQKTWRVAVQHSRFVTARKSAIKLQKSWRMYHHRQNAEAMKMQSAMKVQSTHMSAIMKQQQSKAVLIQKMWRSYSGKKEFSTYCASAVKIQRKFRSHQIQMARSVLQAAQQRITPERAAAIVICLFLRASIKNKQRSREILLCNHLAKAATTTQAKARQYLAKSKFLLSKMKKAAVIIQTSYRRYFALSCYLEQKYSAVLIQSCFRKCAAISLARAKKHAAILVDQKLRLSVQVEHIHHSVILIQSKVRQFMVQKKAILSRKLNAAIVLQAACRGCLAKAWFSKQKESVVLIQSLVRRNLVLSALPSMRLAALAIQTCWCNSTLIGTDVYQEVLFMKQSSVPLSPMVDSQATSIQKIWRSYSAKKEFSTYCASAVKIQREFRSYQIQMARHILQAAQQRAAAIVICHFLRASIKKKQRSREMFVCNHRDKAATTIQAKAREYLAKSKFLLSKMRILLSIILIQSKVRLFMVQKKAILSRKLNAAIILQSACRGCLAKAWFSKQKENIVLIQSLARRNRVLSALSSMRLAALTIQSHWHRSAPFSNVHIIAVQNRNQGHPLFLANTTTENQAIESEAEIALFQSSIPPQLCSTTRNSLAMASSTVIEVNVSRLKFACAKLSRLLKMKLQKINLSAAKDTSMLPDLFNYIQIAIANSKFDRFIVICLDSVNTLVVLFRSIYRHDFGSNFDQALKSARQGWLGLIYIAGQLQESSGDMEFHAVAKRHVVLSFLCFAFIAAAARSPVLCLSFSIMAISVGAQEADGGRRSAAITLQSYSRRMFCRQKFQQERRACIVLQRRTRHMHQRLKLRQKRNACIVLQRWARETLVTSKENEGLEITFNASRLSRRRKTFFASRLFGACLVAMLSITIAVATVYACVLKEIVRLSFLLVELYLLRWVVMKGMKSRDAELQEYRANEQRRALIKLKNNSVFYDQEERFCTLLEKVQKSANQLRNETNEIGSSSDGFENGNEMHPVEACWAFLEKEENRNHAASHIQYSWRRILAVRRNAAVSIQSRFRANLRRQRYKKEMTAVICLQRFIRDALLTGKRKYALYNALEEVSKQRSQIEAAILLQKWYRMAAIKSRFAQLKASIEDQNNNDRDSALVAQAVRVYATHESRHAANLALYTEDRLILSSGGSSDYSECNATPIKFHYAEADVGTGGAGVTAASQSDMCCCGGFEVVLEE